MTSTQYITNMARAFVAAEIGMAAVNYGASKPTRARAEKLLDDYFALVEQAVCWTEQNPLDRRCWCECHMCSNTVATKSGIIVESLS